MSPKLSIIGYGKHGQYLNKILEELGIIAKNLISSSNLDQAQDAIADSDLLVLTCPPDKHNEYIDIALSSKNIKRIYLEKPFHLSASIANRLAISDIQVLTGLWLRETEIFSILSSNLSDFNYISIHHSHDWQIRNPSDHEGIANRLLIHFFDLIFSNFKGSIVSNSILVDSNTCCLQLQLQNKNKTLVHIFISYSSFPYSKIVASTGRSQLILDDGNFLRLNGSNIIEGKGVSPAKPHTSDSLTSFSRLMRDSTRQRLHRFLFDRIAPDDLTTALESEHKLQSLMEQIK
jgi:hypothetical protein